MQEVWRQLHDAHSILPLIEELNSGGQLRKRDRLAPTHTALPSAGPETKAVASSKDSREERGPSATCTVLSSAEILLLQTFTRAFGAAPQEVAKNSPSSGSGGNVGQFSLGSTGVP